MIWLVSIGMVTVGWTEMVLNLARGGYVPVAVEVEALAAYVVAGLVLGALAGTGLYFIPGRRRRALRFAVALTSLAAGYGLFIVYDPHGWAGEATYGAACLVVGLGLAAVGRRASPSRPRLVLRQMVWGVLLVCVFQGSELLWGGLSAARRAFLLPLAILVGELVWGYVVSIWPLFPTSSGSLARSRRIAWILAGVMLLGGVALGAYREDEFSPLVPQERARGPRRGLPNLVIVVLDTTRADRLSLYGYPESTTPNLERLAKDSAVFDRCIATSAWTLPTHASIFTGLFPSRHGAHLAGRWAEMRTRLGMPAVAWPLSEDKLTLAEILHAHGYATAAVVANFSYLFRDFGLSQGFDYYSDAPRFIWRRRPAITKMARELWPSFLLKPYRSAEEINSEALSWLDRRDGGPFFLFLNYMEPHHPWLAPSSGRGWWRELGAGLNRLASRDLYTHEVKVLSPEERRYVSEQYDGEIAHMDRALGELMEALRARGEYDDTLIVVVGDHGELLGEHRSLGHIGRMLYEELLWVPLLVKYPGSRLTGRFAQPVQQVDIFTTVLEALGMPVPAGTQGEALPRVSHPIVAEQYTHGYLVKKYGARYDRDLTAIYLNGRKYIEGSNGERLLFDLARDPREEANLATADPSGLEAATTALARWTGSRPAQAAAKTAISPSAEERLRALGYVN